MLPSDTTVCNQLGKIFAELHAKVVWAFTVSQFKNKCCIVSIFSDHTTAGQAVQSKIAYATDTWTTRQMVHTFACTIGYFIDSDWKLIEHVLDFKVLEDKEHEGLYAGQAFVEGLRKRGRLNKISLHSMTCSVALALTYATCTSLA